MVLVLVMPPSSPRDNPTNAGSVSERSVQWASSAYRR